MAPGCMHRGKSFLSEKTTSSFKTVINPIEMLTLMLVIVLHQGKWHKIKDCFKHEKEKMRNGILCI